LHANYRAARRLAFLAANCLVRLVVGAWAYGGEASAPTTPLASLTPLQEAIVQQFQQEFGETIPRPAVFVPALDPNRTCDWHVTSTAWLKPSATTSRLLTLYTSPDGKAVRWRDAATVSAVAADGRGISNDRSQRRALHAVVGG
jgi:hypothetical protein